MQDPAEASTELPSLADDLAALGIAAVEDSPPPPADGPLGAAAAAGSNADASQAAAAVSAAPDKSVPLPLPHARRFWLHAAVALAPGTAATWQSLGDW